MRQDLLKIVAGAKDVTNAIILTHNVDFVFVQTIVIPTLRKCGSPSLTVFADADCAAQAYGYQARVLVDLGRRYRVVPVAMRPGYRFHPKALLLSGPESATLLVGSGNLTFGGWRESGEIWFRYDSGEDGTAALAAFRSYLQQVVGTCAGPETLMAEIDEAFDRGTRAWAVNMEEPDVLVGRVGRGKPMLEKMVALFGDSEVEELYVCAPYFDEGAAALRSLHERLGSPATTVLVQSERTNLRRAAVRALDPSVEVKAATYRHIEGTDADGEERTREALLHAKFYAVRRAEGVTVVAGSANCSRAALTVRGSAGNAELMAQATMTAAEFEAAFLRELVVQEEEPVLGGEADEDDVLPRVGGYIRVRAARMEGRVLRVAFESDGKTSPSHAEIDGRMIRTVDVEGEWVRCELRGSAGMVVLVGRSGDWEIRSQPHWIDDEQALRTSARGRSLAEVIQTRVRGAGWGIGAWSDVLSELSKHLQYMPKRSAVGPMGGGRCGDQVGNGVEFEWEDVFSDGYGLPTKASIIQRLGVGLEEQIGGLRSMLLRWYGIARPDEEGERSDGDDESDGPEGGPVDDGGDGVDRVSKVPKATPAGLRTAASEREKKRARGLARRIAVRLAEADYLRERAPEVLAADLRIAAVLLRVGLAEGWLTEEEFVDGTMEIWLPLFFSAEGGESRGWLEQRHLTAPDGNEFAKAMGSAELAAALGCWAVAIPLKGSSAKRVLFGLAAVQGIARLPWLWQAGGRERIGAEMMEMVRYAWGREGVDWRGIRQRWLRLVRRGYALERLERAVAGVEIGELRGRIRQAKVVGGELLWQKGAGFCVAEEDCERVDGRKASVLVLQQGRRKIYVGPFLMPLAGLLDKGVLDRSVMPAPARRELRAMIRELGAGTPA